MKSPITYFEIYRSYNMYTLHHIVGLHESVVPENCIPDIFLSETKRQT